MRDWGVRAGGSAIWKKTKGGKPRPSASGASQNIFQHYLRKWACSGQQRGEIFRSASVASRLNIISKMSIVSYIGERSEPTKFHNSTITSTIFLIVFQVQRGKKCFFLRFVKKVAIGAPKVDKSQNRSKGRNCDLKVAQSKPWGRGEKRKKEGRKKKEERKKYKKTL